MSAVTITTINVLDNPAPFTNPLQFEIHYECLTDLDQGAPDARFAVKRVLGTMSLDAPWQRCIV